MTPPPIPTNPVAIWIAGARPRTLPAAVAPVVAGTGAAAYDDAVDWTRAVLALGVSLALQIGVNYANDYSDGIKGTDNDRVGPLRLVGSGLVPAGRVKIAAFLFFAIGAALGLVLSLMTTPWLLLVGAAAILAAWTYTGGPVGALTQLLVDWQTALGDPVDDGYDADLFDIEAIGRVVTEMMVGTYTRMFDA